MVSSGLLSRVALVRTDVSEEPGASFILQEPHVVTTQKTPFFIVTAVKTSNLNKIFLNYGNNTLLSISELIGILDATPN
jgi:hypothetical protein